MEMPKLTSLRAAALALATASTTPANSKVERLRMANLLSFYPDRRRGREAVVDDPVIGAVLRPDLAI